jgi:hypothetical protein
MAKSKVRRQDQDPACNTQSPQTHWMLNGPGADPCLSNLNVVLLELYSHMFLGHVVEQVLQVCSSGDSQPLGQVMDALTCPVGNSTSCCCNVATYAVRVSYWATDSHNNVSRSSFPRVGSVKEATRRRSFPSFILLQSNLTTVTSGH